MDYEYEMFFDDNSPISIHGWWPIATDRIKDQSRIQEYIDKGILRRIDMKEQNSAHGFTEGSEVPKEQASAHSFTELIELKDELERTRLLLQNCNGDIIRADRELTRLRSELQQKDEVMENIKVEYRNKGIDVCRYAAALWSNENGKDSYELMKRLNELKSKAK